MRWLCLAAAAVLAAPSAAMAQRDSAHDRTHVSVMAGITEYDLSGVDQSAIYALRLAVPWHPNLLVEGSLGYVRTEQQFGRTDLFLPELQAQLQGRWGSFSPYVGLGAGLAIDLPKGDTGVNDSMNFAPSFAAGLRVDVAPGVGVRVDGRIHGIEADFTGTVSALTAGLTFTW